MTLYACFPPSLSLSFLSLLSLSLSLHSLSYTLPLPPLSSLSLPPSTLFPLSSLSLSPLLSLPSPSSLFPLHLSSPLPLSHSLQRRAQGLHSSLSFPLTLSLFLGLGFTRAWRRWRARAIEVEEGRERERGERTYGVGDDDVDDGGAWRRRSPGQEISAV
jgi:hypothetical protein